MTSPSFPFWRMSRMLAPGALAATVVPSGAAGNPPLTEGEAYAIGVEAYTYAYPLVLMEVSRRVTTNVAQPDSAKLRAPVNQFTHGAIFPDASFKDVVRPNADTLYSFLWYDVGSEPLVISLPDTGGRYFVVPFMDQWTDVFATLGTRTTGRATGDWALVGPRWQGQLPAGVRQIVSATDKGWIIGRVQTNGPDDYPQVRQWQKQLTAVPLSGWGKQGYTPPAGQVDPAIDMQMPPVDQVARLAPADFFALFAEALKRNPPHAADYAVLLRMERLGLVAGRSFELAKADPAVQRALARAVPDALKHIIERGRYRYVRREGWSVAHAKQGVYGTDYLFRAFIGYAGLGALPPEEAIYVTAITDKEGQPLTGAARYVLHLDKHQIPPVDAFWSLTMYGADQFFVDNPINRYAIGDRDRLAYNADGSLDIYIQRESPGKDKESNWLPAAAGPFSATMRVYLPHAEAADGRWTLPGLTRLP
ncbi:MAG: DUF1254 domain-containing protein [Ottowia sp.]|uniref:DUF1254 domain-containing protein n=1 Tax=Ottowia sp. TaxID=1898956 RepID=UPI0039E3BEDF